MKITIKELKLQINNSQFSAIENLRNKIIKEKGLRYSRSRIIRLGIDELIKQVNNDTDKFLEIISKNPEE
jgi:hypothetical protein